MKLKQLLLAMAMTTTVMATNALAQEPERSGPWLIERTTTSGQMTFTADLKVHAATEVKPALKLRLTPDAFDQVEGNSAIYYLKAMGFLEQASAAERIREFREKNRKLAQYQGLPDDQFPPDVWLDMEPSKLPLANVKEYLSYSAFQPPLLAEATRRKSFSLDRNIREVESPVAYLLPELQSMREVARVQSLRCRVAIAEHRSADAIEILNQQFTMARHLGTDEFVVSNLVGAAVLGIALQDMVYLLQEKDAPNLYWALASLPVPLIDMREALSIERQMWSLQLKALQEVDEATKPAGYWQDFIDRFLPQVRDLDTFDLRQLGSDPQAERTALVTAIAAAYPGAKRYLLDECQMNRAQVDAYSTAHVVFLAMKRFNERFGDDLFKWLHLPYDQMVQHPEFKRLNEVRARQCAHVGWISAPGDQLLSVLQQIRGAQARVQQELGMFQTIEAIRMYGAAHAGQLPASLGDLPYPAPNDPQTGKPFQYVVTSGQAVLSGEPLPHIQFRIKLRMAAK